MIQCFMAFYLYPPKGVISLQNLESYSLSRLHFLMQIWSVKEDRSGQITIVNNLRHVRESECLIEGTTKDRITHYILRLASVDDRQFQEFLIKAERELFNFRLSCLSEDEIVHLLQRFDKYLENISSSDNTETSLLNGIRRVKQNFSWERVVRYYFQGRADRCFSLPFQFVHDLVRRRKTVLHRGMAYVSYSKLAEVLSEFFSMSMKNGLQAIDQEKRHILHADERIKCLVYKLKYVLRKNLHPLQMGKVVLCPLSHDEIDRETFFFPPCMSHLHRVLRMKHRLKHHSRVQYTLFLKEVGLPVHEALMFWREEYSKEPHDSSCKHHWQREEKRYTYSIRHLYGLEGSRVNYRGHCCTSIQQRALNPGDEGGCPFHHFDEKNLLELMDLENISGKWSGNILDLVQRKQYNDACRLFMQQKLRKAPDKAVNTEKKIYASTLQNMEVSHQVNVSSSKKVAEDMDVSCGAQFQRHSEAPIPAYDDKLIQSGFGNEAGMLRCEHHPSLHYCQTHLERKCKNLCQNSLKGDKTSVFMLNEMNDSLTVKKKSVSLRGSDNSRRLSNDNAVESCDANQPVISSVRCGESLISVDRFSAMKDSFDLASDIPLPSVAKANKSWPSCVNGNYRLGCLNQNDNLEEECVKMGGMLKSEAQPTYLAKKCKFVEEDSTCDVNTSLVNAFYLPKPQSCVNMSPTEPCPKSIDYPYSLMEFSKPSHICCCDQKCSSKETKCDCRHGVIPLRNDSPNVDEPHLKLSCHSTCESSAFCPTTINGHDQSVIKNNDLSSNDTTVIHSAVFEKNKVSRKHKRSYNFELIKSHCCTCSSGCKQSLCATGLRGSVLCCRLKCKHLEKDQGESESLYDGNTTLSSKDTTKNGESRSCESETNDTTFHTSSTISDHCNDLKNLHSPINFYTSFKQLLDGLEVIVR